MTVERTAAAPLAGRALVDLLPARVVVEVADPSAPTPALHAEEEGAVANAVEKRRREFALGRACARVALARLGVPPGPIAVGPDRGPLWPEGFVGSITHCDGLVAAAVARARDWAGIGVDAERLRPLSDDVVRLVCTEAERAWVAAPGGDATERALLVFSAKEAVYKAIAPIGKRWVGFEEVEVRFASAGGRFEARFLGALPADLPDPAHLLGRFAVRDALVLTAAALPV